MSSKFATWLKTHLFNCINELASTCSMFVRNRRTDFTRMRKLSFSTVMNLVLQMTGASLNNEILRFFQHQPKVPSTPAFVQQRDKILPEAFKELFTRFTRAFDKFKLFKGYRLLACDSSKINIPLNKEDSQTFVEQKDGAGYNLLCLHALYDLANNIYVDCIVAPQSETDERKALTAMIGHCEQHTPTLTTLDRGYEGYNTLAHFSERGMKFVMRVKDIHSKKQNCILQEIYARLVLFNFCAMVVNYTPVTQSLDKKYEYKINFAAAVGICRAFLLSNGDKINVGELILKYLVPIRPNRSAPRSPKTRSAKSFLYRAA